MSAVVHYGDVVPREVGGAAVHPTHEDEATGLRQAVLRCPAGSSRLAGPGVGRLETLFAVSGHGVLRLPSGTHALAPETAALVAGEQPYEITSDDGLVLVSVSARHDPEVACGPRRSTIDLAAQVAGDAVSEREFRTLFCPDSGCSGVTQFVGYIPPIRTPEHYHPYNEMIFVLDGQGQVRIDGVTYRLATGSCFYLPAGRHHLVENLGDTYLRLLGVFTPAGSPAENTGVAG